MYLGLIVEYGPTARVFEEPAHIPIHKALLSAIPRRGYSESASSRIILKGDLPNPMSPPSGCAFRTRCFRAADACARIEPELVARTEPGHLSACLFPGKGEKPANAEALLQSPATLP